MERIKRGLKRVFFPPPLFVAAVSIPAFAAVAYVLAKGISGPLAYLSYLASAYALMSVGWRVPNLIRSGRKRIERCLLDGKIGRVPLVHRYAKEVNFRAEVSLCLGLLVNLLYIVMKGTLGIYFHSAWFMALAVYYALLALMRLLLLCRPKGPEGKERVKGELRRYRLCGYGLLAMNLALGGMVVFMVRYDRGYEYPGVLIYAMAAYSFYTVIIAVIRVIQSRRHGSPILSAAKAVSLAAALVSILSLETAMLTQFGGEEDPLFRKAMIGATGGGVCVMVWGMALVMIVKASQKLKSIENQNP